jgi:hypothetical protein
VTLTELRAEWEANRAAEATAEAQLASAEAELQTLADEEARLSFEFDTTVVARDAKSEELSEVKQSTDALDATNRDLAQLDARARGLEQATGRMRALAEQVSRGKIDPALLSRHVTATKELGLPLLDVTAAELGALRNRFGAPEPDPNLTLDVGRALTAAAPLLLGLAQQTDARSATARANAARLATLLKGKQSIAEIEASITSLSTRAKALDAELAQVRNARAETVDRIAALHLQLRQLALEVPLRGELLSSLSTTVPLALFPVRLETRFFPGTAADRYELRVRVYPDRIHEDTLSRRLTPNERVAGERYWQALWTAGTAPETREARETAWSELVRDVGVGRAAWIARTIRPENPRSDPAPLFPAPDLRTRAELPPPHATLLPDRWVVMAYQNGRRVLTAWGPPIQTPLAVSLSPETAAPTTRAGALDAWLDDGVRWMVDFDRAEQVGMGVRIDVTRATADLGFDVLLALGVRATTDPGASSTELDGLLQAHRYTTGLGFSRQGTPTNHSETERVPAVTESGVLAGFREEDAPIVLDAASVPDPANKPVTFANGSVTARALGLVPPIATQPTVFEGVLDTELREQLLAHDMNLVTWPASWGYFLDQMLGNTLIPMLAQARGVAREQALIDFRTTLDTWRTYFARNVRARGPLPILRVGSQPYGLLPVTSLDRFRAVAPLAKGLCVYESNGSSLRAHHASANPDILAWSTLAPTSCGPVSGPVVVTATDLEADGRRDLVLGSGSPNAAPRISVLPLADPALDDVLPPTGQSVVPFATGEVSAIAVFDLDNIGAAEDVLLVLRTPGGPVLALGRGLDRSSTILKWSGPFALPPLPAGTRELSSGLALADLDGFLRRPGPAIAPERAPGIPLRPRPLDTRFDARPHVVLARVLDAAGRNSLEITTGSVIEATGTSGVWTSTRIDLGALRPAYAGASHLDVALTLEPNAGGGFDLLIALSDRREISVYRLVRFKPNATFDGSPKLVIDRATSAGFRLVGLAVEAGGRVHRASLAPDLDGFADLLADLRRLWRIGLDAVPSLNRGRTDGDVDRAVLEALAMDAVSMDFRLRSALGPAVSSDLAWFRSGFPSGFQPPPSWLQERDTLRTWLETELRLPSAPWDPAQPPGATITKFTFVDPADATLLSLAPGTKNLFAWIANARPADLHVRANAPEDSLLSRFLSQALGWSYAGVAFDAFPPDRVDVSANFDKSRDPELIDLLPSAGGDDGGAGGSGTITPWRHLAGTEPNAAITRGDLLAQQAKNGGAPPPLQTSVDAFMRLARETAALGLSAEQTLDGALLLGESLDLASHRLDAWITSLATERLEMLRANTTSGIQLGGYGWVLGLKPRGGHPLSEGYLHAPSAVHAAAAAVLRSGQLSHANTQAGSGAGSLSSIDLSSARTRLALEILAGVKSGQSLGALLGYRFERGLRERGLSALTPAFRELAPEKGGQPLDGVDRALPVAGAVADGLGLIGLWQGSPGAIPWGDATLGLPDTNSSDAAQIRTLFASLADTLDAVKDLCLAEGVYQMVRGLPQRAAAAMDALSRGDAMPEFEFPNTPRTGTSLTHRLLALMSDSAVVPNGWSGARNRPRAQVEPTLDAWVARVLGDPSRVACRVQYTSGTSGAVTTLDVALDELRLCALDFLCFPPFSTTARGTELELRILDAAEQQRAPDAESKETLSISWDPPPDALAVADFMTLVNALGDLIAHSRPLSAADLGADATLVATGTDVTTRLTAARTRLETAAATLENSAADVAAVREALAEAAGFGVTGAFSPASAATADIAAQATAVATEIEHRLERATADLTPDQTLRALFGGGFSILPELTIAPSYGATLVAAQDARATLEDTPPNVTSAWLRGVARVRENPARLETVTLFSEALSDWTSPLELAVMQLPVGDGSSPWVGLATAQPKSDWPSNPTSLVTLGDLDAIDPQHSSTISGLLFDEWTELVPGTREVTSWMFHYDAPGSAPPQSVLLAVPPVPGEAWDLAKLEAVVLGTLELARLRAVTLDDLAGSPLVRLLPAVYLAENVTNDTIAANLET